MKTVTLLSGIALLLNAVFNLYNFAQTVTRIRSFQASSMAPYILDHATWVIAEVCMGAFFFVLYTKQKT